MAYEYRRKVGSYLRDQRLRIGMTQAELGKVLGMGHTAISAIELGRGSVPPERYAGISSVLGLQEEEFGKFLLRYTNPWLHALIYGTTDKILGHDLKKFPTCVSEG